MMRSTIVWLLLTVCSGAGLFVVKHEVQDLEERLARLESAIGKDREAIHVLHAEWAYLNEPGRLAALAQRHLALRRPRTDQIADSVERLPEPIAPAGPEPKPGAEPSHPTLAIMRSEP